MEDNVKQFNVMALLGFICSFLIPVVGLIFSIIGLKKVNELKSGKSLCVAGIVISIVSFFISFILSLILF